MNENRVFLVKWRDDKGIQHANRMMLGPDADPDIKEIEQLLDHMIAAQGLKRIGGIKVKQVKK